MRPLLSLHGSVYGCRQRRLPPYVVGSWEYIEFAEGQLTRRRLSAWGERGVTVPVQRKKSEDNLIHKGNTKLY